MRTEHVAIVDLMTDETQEPTLRNGDESVDGWVEYAKSLLFETAILNDLTLDWEDGRFDDEMETVVRLYQTQNGCLSDGIIGNQTWAALRGEEPQAIGTDGHEPGTYVEHGIEARWRHEDEGVTYNPADDQLIIGAFNTGSDPLDRKNFDAAIVLEADGKHVDATDFRFTNANDGGDVAQAGDMIWIVIDDVSKLMQIASPDEMPELRVAARMSSELGGDMLESPAGVIN